MKKKTKKDYEKERLLRMDIIATLYKRGNSYRAIREEVMARLNLETYSLKTVSKDVHLLLKEWREERLSNIDDALQLELTRIDEIVKEAWSAWERSKGNYEKNKQRMKGLPNEDNVDGGILTTELEQTKENGNNYGDPRYLDVVHKNLIERRKLLGLYKPEKKEVSGNFSFERLLMETGVVDDEE